MGEDLLAIEVVSNGPPIVDAVASLIEAASINSLGKRIEEREALRDIFTGGEF